MVKKTAALLILLAMMIVSSGCSVLTSEREDKDILKDFKVVVFTDDKKTNKERYNSVESIKEEIKKKSNKKSNNDKDKNDTQFAGVDLSDVKLKVIHQVIPQNFEKYKSSVESKINKYIKDKKVQAIVVSTNKTGFLPILQNVRQKRPEIITISAPMGEDPKDLSNSVDLNFGMDIKKEDESFVELSKKLGADAFLVYASNQDLTNKDNISIIEDIKQQCKSQKLKFEEIKIPNNKDNASKAFDEDINNKIKKYGSNINVLGLNADLDNIIIKKAKDLRYIVAKQSVPNPMVNYPEIMNYKIPKKDSMDFSKMNDKISEWAKQNDLSSKLGGYPVPYDFFLTSFATEISIQMAESDLTQEDVCGKDYLEGFAGDIFGIGSYFKSMDDSMRNYQLVNLEPYIY